MTTILQMTISSAFSWKRDMHLGPPHGVSLAPISSIQCWCSKSNLFCQSFVGFYRICIVFFVERPTQKVYDAFKWYACIRICPKIQPTHREKFTAWYQPAADVICTAIKSQNCTERTRINTLKPEPNGDISQKIFSNPSYWTKILVFVFKLIDIRS